MAWHDRACRGRQARLKPTLAKVAGKEGAGRTNSARSRPGRSSSNRRSLQSLGSARCSKLLRLLEAKSDLVIQSLSSSRLLGAACRCKCQLTSIRSWKRTGGKPLHLAIPHGDSCRPQLDQSLAPAVITDAKCAITAIIARKRFII
jgi:hypothetical protein